VRNLYEKVLGLPYPEGYIDIHALIEKKDEIQLIHLFELIIEVAVQGEYKEMVIDKITKLDENDQLQLKILAEKAISKVKSEEHKLPPMLKRGPTIDLFHEYAVRVEDNLKLTLKVKEFEKALRVEEEKRKKVVLERNRLEEEVKSLENELTQMSKKMITEKSEADEDYLRKAFDLESQLLKSNKRIEKLEEEIKVVVSESKEEIVMLKVI